MNARNAPSIAPFFKSVVLFPESQEEDNSWGVSVDDLCRWLREYQSWFVEECGWAEGRNLHLRYHREVLLSGRKILEEKNGTQEISDCLKAIGLPLSLSTTLLDVISHYSALTDLLRIGAFSSISIDIPSMGFPFDESACKKVFQSLADEGISLGLKGNLQTLRTLGILQMDSLNQKTITFRPAISAERSEAIQTSWTRPCHNRFFVFVNSAGELFPCNPLTGIRSCRMGTIWQPLLDTALGGGDYSMDLRMLAQKGPFVRQEMECLGESGMPLDCILHRNMVLQANQ